MTKNTTCITRITPDTLGRDVLDYVLSVGERIKENEKFPGWEQIDLERFCRHHLLAIAYKGSEPVGLLMATIGRPIFTQWIRTLRQEVLWAEKIGVASSLLDYMIDFGKDHADHVITMIGGQTNIKPRSLEKKGFAQLEVLYRMEV